jgi:hypothetical protein
MLEIRNFLELALIITIFSLVLFRKMTLFQAYAFFIPYFGIDYDIGVRYTISQLTLLLLNLHFFVIAASNTKFLKLKGLNGSIVLFLLYAFVSAALLSTFVIEFIPTGNPGFLRNEGRYISQIINYSLIFSIFYIAYYQIKSLNDTYIILKFFIIGIIVTSFIGIAQEIIFIISGIDITPLAGSENWVRQAGSFDYFGLPMIRICSLSGEPKSLGMYAAIGIIILNVCNTLQIKLIKYSSFFTILFYISLLFTLSTSGFVLLGILWLLSELILRYFKLLPTISAGKIFSWIMILIAVVVFAGPLNDIINDRITERDIVNEDFDVVVKTALTEQPQWLVFGSGLGNIHNIAYRYIDRFENIGSYMDDNIFVAKSGYLRILSECGFVGFILFFIFNAQIIINAFLGYNNNKLKIYAIFATLSIIAFVSYLARTYVTEFYLLIMAMANVLNKKITIL